MNRFVAFTTFVAISIIAGSAVAADDPLPRSFVHLEASIEKIDNRPTTWPMLADPHKTSELQENVGALLDASSHLSSGLRSDYARSLDHDAKLISESADTKDPGGAQIFSDAFEDLKIKASYAKSAGISTTFNGTVAVEVSTKQGTKTVNGYVIVLNPLRYSGSEPFARLLNQSSPAKGSVPPGRYEVSALLKDKVVARQVIPIGVNAESTVPIDLPVP